ncbi:MAG: hypothetical protein LBH44_00340 [Treponema sp.]|nr:hypothetical protein [Treponema sp.]
MLRCGKSIIHRHIKHGTLPFPWILALNGQRLIRASVIKQWMAKREIPAGVKPGNI